MSSVASGLDDIQPMASLSPHPHLRLPSIHEMLPNHLRADSPHYLHPLGYDHHAPRPVPTRSFSAQPPTTRSILQTAASPPDTSLFHGDNGSADDFDFDYALIRSGDGQSGGEQREVGKKYQCDTCGKLFNRPSSLRIHANTHTGATPFQCPYPNCGRAFNVNSNMRRHYRNHGAPPLPTASSSSSTSKPIAIAPSPASTPTPPPPPHSRPRSQPQVHAIAPVHPIPHSTLFLRDDADPTSAWSHSVAHAVNPQPSRSVSLPHHPVLQHSHSHSEAHPHVESHIATWPSSFSAFTREYVQPYPHHAHAHTPLTLHHTAAHEYE